MRADNVAIKEMNDFKHADLAHINYFLDDGFSIHSLTAVGNMFHSVISAEAMQILMDHGVDPNIKGEYGDSALTRAAFTMPLMLQDPNHPEVINKKKVIDLLLAAGLDINYQRDKDKKTALMLVTNLEIAKYLIEKGADATLKDKYGHYAHDQHIYELGGTLKPTYAYLEQQSLSQLAQKALPVTPQTTVTPNIRQRL